MLDSGGRKNRGLLSLMRRHEPNLTEEQIPKLERYLADNGITEGLHTKMEMISRRAFGFRGFKNYRLRVIALCEWNGVLAIRN